MLTNYIRHAGNGLTKSGQALSVDTAAIATRARVQKGIDSVATLATAGVTSVATAYGLSGGTITTTGTISADTLQLSTRAWRQKGLDSLAALEISGSGTAGQVAFFDGTRSITGETAFQWDATNNRLGLSGIPSFDIDVLSTSPQMRLSSSTGTSFSLYRAQNSGGTLFMGLENSAGSALSTGAAYSANIYHSGAYPIIFHTNSTQRMRITSDGELLIATTTDAGDYKLQVSGNAYVTGTTVLAATSGNVGVGTASPQDFIHMMPITSPSYMRFGFASTFPDIYGRIGHNGNSGGFEIYTQYSSTNVNSGNIRFINGQSGSTSEKMRITYDGKIGIGTSSPISDGTVDVATSDNNYMRLRSTTALRAYMYFQNSITGTTTSDGMNIGVNDAGNMFINNRESSDLYFGTANTTRMAITSAGEVLVNTTTDAGNYGLQVNSNTYINGNMYVNTTTGFNTYFTQPLGGGGLSMVSTIDPSAADQRLFSLGFGSLNYNAQVRVEAYASESWSSTNRGSYLSFSTTNSGSSARSEKLRVNNDGGLRFIGQSAAPTAEAGTVYYDTDDNKLKVYNGTTWVDLH
jgi:hypothetical protein